jgi:transcription elongation factor Elf1
MKIKISATFEGKCMLCGKDTTVFSAGDEDTKKVVTICKKCSENLGDKPTAEVIEKYGEVNEETFEGGEIQVKGLGELQKELK